MWENAASMDALLVFAEHRYYGKSWPFQTEERSMKHLRYVNANTMTGAIARWDADTSESRHDADS